LHFESFEDPGIQWFQQIDFDGKISTSPSFSVQGIKPEQPFQFNQNQELSFLAIRSGKFEYQIFNQLGILVRSGSIFAQQNERMILPTQNLPSGNYIIRAESNAHFLGPFKFSIFR
jgi:hypothetical protein